ncbi:MAG: glycosyltransferase family 2 protein [Actinobacteria bacterium]|nr:glycosyltransferase family 2 protein [Actinomycetota bacterium]
MRKPFTAGVPLVRAVVVNFNGGDLTLDCLRSLLDTDWPPERLEVVLVDNASTDGVVDRVRSKYPGVTVMESGGNVGFAGGCNVALAELGDTDYVALVNNDATVAPDWLSPLVVALDTDPSIGAACPKILFSTPFVDVHVESETRVQGRGDYRELGVRLSGLRVGGADLFRQAQLLDGFGALEYGDGAEARYRWTAGAAQVRVPVAPGGPIPDDAELRLAADQPTPAALRSPAGRVEITVGPRAEWYSVPLGGEPYDVINSVGSILVHGEYGADRGYLEPDRGQYDAPAEVFAWSGAAVLLSRRYLADVGMFDDRYFLYYEDLDLAWRGRRCGWRYRYVPESVVRHVHSATSDEGSKLFAFHNERNRLLTLARNAPLRQAVAATMRSLLVTASYARRDVLSPLLRGRAPRWGVVAVRLRALASFARLLPGTLAARRR